MMDAAASMLPIDHLHLRSMFMGLLTRMRPDTFCDIGAFDARDSIEMRNALPHARMIAFEGNPEIHAAFCREVATHGIDYRNLVIGDADGDTAFYAPQSVAGMHESVLTRKGSLRLRTELTSYTEYRVQSSRLDSYLGPLKPERVALWIDAEGAADRVLVGAAETLSKTWAVFVEVEAYPFWQGQVQYEDIVSMLRSFGLLPIARDNQFGEQQFNIVFGRCD